MGTMNYELVHVLVRKNRLFRVLLITLLRFQIRHHCYVTTSANDHPYLLTYMWKRRRDRNPHGCRANADLGSCWHRYSPCRRDSARCTSVAACTPCRRRSDIGKNSSVSITSRRSLDRLLLRPLERDAVLSVILQYLPLFAELRIWYSDVLFYRQISCPCRCSSRRWHDERSEIVSPPESSLHRDVTAKTKHKLKI